MSDRQIDRCLHQDGEFIAAILFADFSAHLKTVDFRHQDVENDKIGIAFRDFLDCLVAVPRKNNIVKSLVRETFRDDLPVNLTVVDNQNQGVGVRVPARGVNIIEMVPAYQSRAGPPSLAS